MSHSQTSLFPNTDPEQTRTEYKSCGNGHLPADIWKTISAFSNAEGGQIILGVDPDGRIIGLDTNSIDKLQRDILSICRESFNYPIVPEIQVIGSVVAVYVAPALAAVRPVYSVSRGLPRGAYVRIGSANIQLTDEMRNQFAVAARGGAELIAYPELNYSRCFDMGIVSGYIDMVNASRHDIYSGIAPSDVLKKLRAVTDQDHPTLFGLLAFSRDTYLQEATAPTTNVAITQYAGTEKTSIDDYSSTFIDDVEFSGNVIQQFRDASVFIRSKLPIRGRVDESGIRRTSMTIPEIAIRESLANALTHRDYSTFSSRVQVDIYSDRIEIINPGQSLVPIEALDSTPSVSRNPSLMSFLKDYHITEQRARGIRTIRESLRSAGLKEPLFENLPSSFRVTLYSSAFISSDDHVWLQQFRPYGLNERQLTALTHLKHSDIPIANSDYRQMNNMTSVGDDRRARHELEVMVKHGLIEPKGTKRYKKYYLKTSGD